MACLSGTNWLSAHVYSFVWQKLVVKAGYCWTDMLENPASDWCQQPMASFAASASWEGERKKSAAALGAQCSESVILASWGGGGRKTRISSPIYPKKHLFYLCKKMNFAVAGACKALHQWSADCWCCAGLLQSCQCIGLLVHHITSIHADRIHELPQCRGSSLRTASRQLLMFLGLVFHSEDCK